MRSFIILTLLIICAACAPAAAPSNVTVFPTQPPLPGSVTINHPPDGSIIYAEALYLEGSASDLPAAGFRLEVTSALDELLADVMIQPEANDWSIELVHEYAGDPIEVTILALPADETIDNTYDIVSSVIAPLETRPDGAFGSLLSPARGALVGGDVLQIVGTASAIPDNELTIQLTEPDETVINETSTTINSPYPLDEIVWEANLETTGYTGPAIVIVSYSDENGEIIEIGRAEVNVSVVAG